MPLNKSLGNILAASENRLQSTLERAYQLQAISRQMQDTLGSPLGDHLSLGNLRDDMAILLADSPVWLSKARYEAANILYILRQLPGLEHLQKVHFKVKPSTSPSPEQDTIPRRLQLSQDNAQLLKSTAAGVSDANLSAALERLAQRAKSTKPR
jgi:hypothetical protein